MCIAGRWEPGREGASAALAWMPSGTMPRSAAFPVLVNQRPSAAQGLFHRNRIINAIGMMALTL